MVLRHAHATRADQIDRNKEIAFYAFDLAQGSIMFSTTMNFGSIKNYLAEASFVALNHQQIDPLLNEHSLGAQCIKKVLSEVK